VHDIALSFDNGPDRDTTPQVLEALAARDADAAGTSASGQSTGAGAGTVSDDEIVDAEVVDDDSNQQQ
jgi:hypothetical protein